MLLLWIFMIAITVFFIALFIIGVITIVAGLIGGTTTALLVKNKIFKRLLFIGFCIIFLFGILCLSPIIASFANLSGTFFTISFIFINICIVALATIGIKFSMSINNKIGRTILTIVFCIVIIAVLSLFVISLIFVF